MNTAAKGRRLEHRSRAILEAAGYYVLRSAGSKGLADLVASGAAETVLVQVKANAWPSGLDLEALRELRRGRPWLRILAHRWRARVRLPDVREIS